MPQFAILYLTQQENVSFHSVFADHHIAAPPDTSVLPGINAVRELQIWRYLAFETAATLRIFRKDVLFSKRNLLNMS